MQRGMTWIGVDGWWDRLGSCVSLQHVTVEPLYIGTIENVPNRKVSSPMQQGACNQPDVVSSILVWSVQIGMYSLLVPMLTCSSEFTLFNKLARTNILNSSTLKLKCVANFVFQAIRMHIHPWIEVTRHLTAPKLSKVAGWGRVYWCSGTPKMWTPRNLICLRLLKHNNKNKCSVEVWGT